MSSNILQRQRRASYQPKATPALAPKLRFPEFRGAEEWQIKTFEKLFTVGNGRDYKHLSLGDVPVYGSGGYMLSVDDYLYEGDSVCIGRKGTINNPMFLTGRFWTVDTLFYTHSFKECLPQFIFSIFLQIDWLKHNEAGGVPSLSKTNIEKIKTAVPTPAEQQKIAECLSSVDEVIAAQARKLDALKTHKKGLMQQLFPREGETQPRLRFPEFEDKGKWEVKQFSELCDIKHGYAFESGFFNNEGDYVLLTPGNFNEQGGYRDRGELQKYFTGEIPPDYVLTKDDMLVAMTEQAAGLLGSPILVPEPDKFLHNQRLGLVVKRPGVVWANEFFFHIFNTQRVRKAIHDTASGAKVRHTSPTKIGDVAVSVPTALPEQQRIAACLSTLDDLLAAETQKLAALKTHKRGLMQQLFPSPEEAEA